MNHGQEDRLHLSSSGGNYTLLMGQQASHLGAKSAALCRTLGVCNLPNICTDQGGFGGWMWEELIAPEPQ